MPVIEDVDQLSAEWVKMRVGSVTASRVADAISFLKKGGESAERKRYKTEIVSESLTGLAADHYVSPAMDFGIQTEPLAIAAYERAFDVEVHPGGLWAHGTIGRFMASPDGLVGADGLIECKCPMTATHIDYLLAGVAPEEYQTQMLSQMACTGRAWCDFISFDPRLPKRHQMMCIRFLRDDKRIEEIGKEVKKFLEEVDLTIANLEKAVSQR